jgi:hypothetical protein
LFCFERSFTKPKQKLISEIVNNFREISAQEQISFVVTSMLWVSFFATVHKLHLIMENYFKNHITHRFLYTTPYYSRKKVLTSHHDHITANSFVKTYCFHLHCRLIESAVCRINKLPEEKKYIWSVRHFILNKFSFHLSNTRKNFFYGFVLPTGHVKIYSVFSWMNQRF